MIDLIKGEMISFDDFEAQVKDAAARAKWKEAQRLKLIEEKEKQKELKVIEFMGALDMEKFAKRYADYLTCCDHSFECQYDNDVREEFKTSPALLVEKEEQVAYLSEMLKQVKRDDSFEYHSVLHNALTLVFKASISAPDIISTILPSL